MPYIEDSIEKINKETDDLNDAGPLSQRISYQIN
jgi:hypothetical protein